MVAAPFAICYCSGGFWAVRTAVAVVLAICYCSSGYSSNGFGYLLQQRRLWLSVL